MYGNSHAIVFDISSELCKIGFSGNSIPSSVFPTLSGKRKYCCSLIGNIDKFYGDEAYEKKRCYNCR